MCNTTLMGWLLAIAGVLVISMSLAVTYVGHLLHKDRERLMGKLDRVLAELDKYPELRKVYDGNDEVETK